MEKSIKKEMTNIGKWLAIVLIVFVLGFMVLAFGNSTLLESFKDWTTRILYIVVGGAVIYIVINLTFGKKRRGRR